MWSLSLCLSASILRSQAWGAFLLLLMPKLFIFRRGPHSVMHYQRCWSCFCHHRLASCRRICLYCAQPPAARSCDTFWRGCDARGAAQQNMTQRCRSRRSGQPAAATAVSWRGSCQLVNLFLVVPAIATVRGLHRVRCGFCCAYASFSALCPFYFIL